MDALSDRRSPHPGHLAAADGGGDDGVQEGEEASEGSAHSRSPRGSSSSNNSHLEDRGEGAVEEEAATSPHLHHPHRLHPHHHHHHHHPPASIQLGLEAGPGLGEAAQAAGLGGPMGLPPPPQHITSI